MGTGIGWTIALGTTTAVAVALAIAARPRDPTFSLHSISLSSLHLRFPTPPIPVLDVEFTLSISLTNPNLNFAPISYWPSSICIYYDDTLLGQAKVEACSQSARSVRTLRLMASLDGLKLTHHLARLMWGVIRREMESKAVVKIEGKAKLLIWEHPFVMYVESNVVVDPLFLDVLDQETKSRLHLSFSTNNEKENKNKNVK
ncbi:uncharacterized protein LOC18441260 [Amborella trichopoda]|uniref:Late embryogenesis abundant protein LEA-2 subgroup domain-containing protein n=1 Tax=Amborella trichopoda TaxID=13333 RepID=W1PXN4_AMBTC|nr:uncharacterized protein LOC18441260 [Amborella trichopoda]ERN13023.1 hypothetical protein AMTR_s00040p00102560 [Amborella trichopoda]|eukprot:XP_006851442.1 uncharacterized protein LOC18441260 [Amborella trichopoda]